MVRSGEQAGTKAGWDMCTGTLQSCKPMCSAFCQSPKPHLLPHTALNLLHPPLPLPSPPSPFSPPFLPSIPPPHQVGRPIPFGLAVEGQAGVENILRILKEEFELAMALAGCTKVSDIKRALVETEADSFRKAMGLVSRL